MKKENENNRVNEYLVPQVYLYMRFSKNKQEEGDSFRRQMSLAQKVSKERKIPINDDLVMRDKGLSAFKAEHVKRGALGKFLAAVKTGVVVKGSILIVESMDRLSRDVPLTAQDQFNSLMSNGITVITSNDQFVYDKRSMNSGNGQVYTVMGSMQRAHDESKHKHIRSMGVIEGKIKHFHEEGKAKSIGGDPFWVKTENGYLALDEKKAESVKLIIKLYLQEHKGLNLIARELTERGYKTPTGRNKSWGVTTIRKILDNPALYGLKKYSLTYLIDGEYETKGPFIHENFYPPLVSKEEFDIIQERKKNCVKARDSSKEGKVYLLSSYGKDKCVCADCGRATRSQYQKQKNRKGEFTGKEVLRLHCGKHKETKDCNSSILCHELETAFIRSIATHVNPKFLEKGSVGKIDEERLRKDISLLDAQIDELLKTLDSVNSIEIIIKLNEKIKKFDSERQELKELLTKSYEQDTGAEDSNEMRELAEKCTDPNNSEERGKFKRLLLQSIDKIIVSFKDKSLSAHFKNGNHFSLSKDNNGKYQTIVFYKRRPK
ncbi:recombinase family protein [Vibrio splendidus]|uniref:recombinase family protein n=1 Tax=Vibrio splendidus TaxID=29497 RepID=UPI001E4DD569|nr:recombinase family protein [Vibrio splendidus]MCC4787692.1 recombinase family protein [Vibrio splendidus]